MRFELLDSEMSLDESHLDIDEDTLRAQLAAYGRGERREFDVPVSYPEGLVGDVMRLMAAIPYGQTRTYGDLAAELDSSAQAVGQACGANPVPIVVPCHRVVAADGLGGFSAEGGTDLKRRLLALESGESLARFV
ncbi:methylated-DNA-[protein]-cysteine S-methyltransferase [Halogranum rubrum]|uniref:Methylated-DNA-[protein]-cysteine S-methyltransferase n=1 Tax=Halogranum rubrum TaxID=553466 RepID=A0A1I4I792_9EURY|nr:MGMT family protein [Halogranum rubrum]SFL50259.1 methylated-DNA-[protein]-cysteine S-methyltransferase [Halogranum rubrum]